MLYPPLRTASIPQGDQHGLTGLINDTGLIAPNGDIDDDINVSMRVNACQRVSVDEFDVCITRSNFLTRANACQFVPIRANSCPCVSRETTWVAPALV